MTERLTKAGATPQQNIILNNEAVGIELDLKMFGGGTTVPQTGTGPQTLKRRLPTNHAEARDMLPLIQETRSGKKVNAFNVNELKIIARNLNEPTTGNKTDLARRIRAAVMKFYNIQA